MQFPCLHLACGVFQKLIFSNWSNPLVVHGLLPPGVAAEQAETVTGLEPNHSATCACTLSSSDQFIQAEAHCGCLACECIMVVSAHPVTPSLGMTDAMGFFSLCSKLTCTGHDPEVTTPSDLKSDICTL